MITATFTDPQGVEHTNAVFCVRSANHHKNENESYTLSSFDYTTENSRPLTVNENLSCSFYYWVSQSAKDNGLPPYVLTNSSGSDYDFSFQPDDAYSQLTLIEKAEKYLLDVIIPSMQE